MKILLFYDNFLRDYRGLSLLKTVLISLKSDVTLEPLWDNAIEKIKDFNPDTVVMGQVGEYSTSIIALFCHQNGINIVLNSTETVDRDLGRYLKLSQNGFNENIIDFQVITSRDWHDYIQKNKQIKNKAKYKFLGYPRLDLTIDPTLRLVESKRVSDIYSLHKYNRIFLYASSFIYEKDGGQIDKEDQKDYDPNSFLAAEQKLKLNHYKILKQFISKFLKKGDVLLIKKHPWDKSNYYKNTFGGSKCIVLNGNEYSTSVLANCDYLLHTESTMAVEAWILGVKTLSLLPNFKSRKTLSNHMKYEQIVKTYSELVKVLKSNSNHQVAEKSLKNFEPFLDGKSTVRLAREIIKLKPKASKTKFNKSIISKIKRKITPSEEIREKLAKTNPRSYTYHLLEMELEKNTIDKLYKMPFDDYVRRNLK